MRCSCCNRNLSDYESVLRHPVTLDFLDTCTKCLKDIPIEPIEPSNKFDDVGYEDDNDDGEIWLIGNDYEQNED